MSSGSTTEIESAIFSGGEEVIDSSNETKAHVHEYPEGGLRAWLVVFGCWCTSFASFGYVNSFGVYETYYLKTFLSGHSPSDVAWIGALQSFAQFSAALVAGPLADRYGAMVIIWPFSVLLVVAMMLTSLCTELYQFILCQGIFIGISAGLIFTPAISIVGHYFHRRRPIAMAFATTGSPLGGIIYPVIMTNLLQSGSVGFAWAQRICGFLTLFLLAIASIAIRPTPLKRKGALVLPDAFKIPAFSLQVAALFMIILGLWTPYFYLADYGSLHGMSPGLASYLFALINAGSFLGRVFAGSVAKYLGQFNVITVACYASGLLMFCWLKITSTAGLIVLAILFGATSGIIIGLMYTTISHTADHPSKIGTYIGMSTFLIGFGALGGTPITGALIDRYGGYSQGIIFSGAVLMTGAVLFTGARIIALGNISGCPLESFEDVASNHVWLRDILPAQLVDTETRQPMARVMTYGYQSILNEMNGRMTLEALGTAFVKVFTALSNSSQLKPTILIGHGFGGLVIKQALASLSKLRGETEMNVFRTIRGVVFFGVPHDGMDITSFQLAAEHPNQQVIESLRRGGSESLDQLHAEFLQAFSEKRETEIFSFYETLESDISRQDTTSYTGVVVTKASATRCHLGERNGQHRCAIPRSNANLARFEPHDPEFDAVRNTLLGITQRAAN
nr:hypothetical protein [Trichoderma harzianum]